MSSVRLRTKFLLSFLLVSAGLTSATLWMVHRSVRIQLQKEIANDLRNSVTVFQDFQRQREVTLARSAELLASLPSLKALMTTRDSATIQAIEKRDGLIEGFQNGQAHGLRRTGIQIDGGREKLLTTEANCARSRAGFGRPARRGLGQIRLLLGLKSADDQTVAVKKSNLAGRYLADFHSHVL